MIAKLSAQSVPVSTKPVGQQRKQVSIRNPFDDCEIICATMASLSCSSELQSYFLSELHSQSLSWLCVKSRPKIIVYCIVHNILDIGAVSLLIRMSKLNEIMGSI